MRKDFDHHEEEKVTEKEGETKKNSYLQEGSSSSSSSGRQVFLNPTFERLRNYSLMCGCEFYEPL